MTRKLGRTKPPAPSLNAHLTTMNTKPHLPAALTAVILLLLFAGCSTPPVAEESQESTKYTIEGTEKFTFLDKAAPGYLACTGLQDRLLPDGRLEVVASVKNRSAEPRKVQLNCVFKDAQGLHTGDETPFQTVTLAANATEAVRFTAASPVARNYTIRVRQAR